jgi:hypothetical protein
VAAVRERLPKILPGPSAVIAAIILVGFAGVAPAQVSLSLINEYPATSISAEADTFFAEAITGSARVSAVARHH